LIKKASAEIQAREKKAGNPSFLRNSVGRMPTLRHSSIKFSEELRYFGALLPELPLTLYQTNILNMKLQVSCTLLELKVVYLEVWMGTSFYSC
jgi:hypothetical protein